MMSNLEDFAKNYIEQHPSQAMVALGRLKSQEAAEYLASLGEDNLLKVAPFVPIVIAAELLTHPDKNTVATVIAKLPIRLLARWFWFVKPSNRDEILELLKPEQKKVVQSLLAVSKNVAGAIADINMPAITVGTDIRTCIENIFSIDGYGSNYIYIVDHDGKLVGVSSLRKLFLATDNKDMNIESIMNNKVSSVFFQTRLLDLVNDPMWIKYDVLPVVGAHGDYLGAISHKKIRALNPCGEFSRKEEIRGNLGELYNVGMFSLLESVCSIVGSDKREVKGDD